MFKKLLRVDILLELTITKNKHFNKSLKLKSLKKSGYLNFSFFYNKQVL